MSAALKIVATDSGSDVSIHAVSLEDRFKWLKQVRRTKLNGNAAKAAAYLFDCCNSETGQCNPTMETIERECMITNAKRSIKELREAGLIESQRQGIGRNQYFLILRPYNNFSNGSSATQRRVMGDPTDGSSATQPLGHERPNIVNTESNREINKESESAPNGADLSLVRKKDPPKKRTGRRKPKTTFPFGETLTDELRDIAEKIHAKKRPTDHHLIDIETEFQKFRNNALKNDSRWRDWKAAWRNWCLNDQYPKSMKAPGSISRRPQLEDLDDE